MAEIITNLHPDGDENTNLYPNIKKQNIPSKSISTDKLDDNVLSLIGSLKPSGTDTSTNILGFTSNKGIYVATDNGHWYYWNGSVYADGGVYQSSEDIEQIKEDLSKVGSELDKNLESIASGSVVYLSSVDTNMQYGAWSCINGNILERTDRVCTPNVIDFSQGYVLQLDYDITKYMVNIMYFDTYDSTTTEKETGFISISPVQIGATNSVCARLNVKKVDSTEISQDDFNDITKNVIVSKQIPSLLATRPYVQQAIKNLKSYTDSRIDGTVVTVGANKDYNDLRLCLESITPTKEKPVTVYLEGGTYDIRGYYTESERSASNFVGLKIPDYTTLIGVGGSENTKLIWDGTNDSPNSKISTLNIGNVATLIGLTVIGNNIRYVIHDDFAVADLPNIRYVKDCVFKSDSLVFDYVYGSGEIGGSDWTFENCKFIAPTGKCAFLQHNNVNETKASYLHFKNCRFRGSTNVVVVLSSLNNGTTSFNHAYFEGCKIFDSTGNNAKITLNENSASAYGSGIKYKVSGYGNKLDSVIINNTDGEDYSSFVDLI